MSSIYVSNLEENISESQLLSHFSKFGFLIECKMGKMEDGKCKGYAKLTTKDAEAYRLILNTEHIFNGRRARVEPFIKEQGQALLKDKDIIERRVCVLGVPKGLKDAEFKIAFGKFGEVGNAYIRENKNRKKNHGFVTFVEKVAAEQALESQYLVIEGWGRVQIREFRSKALQKKQKREQIVQYPQNTQVNHKKQPFLQQRQIPFFNQNMHYNNRNFEQYHQFPNCRVSSPQHSAESNFTDDSSLGSQGYRKNTSALSNNTPKFEESYNYSFMNEKHLKIYLKKILENNPQIAEIEEKQVQQLELFYYNKKDRFEAGNRKTSYNYESIVDRFALRVYRNHNPENIRKNVSSKGEREMSWISPQPYGNRGW